MKIINTKTVILTSIATLILSTSFTTQAKIYKWTDANGQTHYTAQPPVQKKLRVKAQNIEDKIKANAGKYRAPEQTKVAASTESNTASDDKAEELELAGPNPQLVKYCDSQRNNIEQLKKNFRNVWIDVKGKKTTLTQEQRQEKVAMLAEKLKTDCADVPASKK